MMRLFRHAVLATAIAISVAAFSQGSAVAQDRPSSLPGSAGLDPDIFASDTVTSRGVTLHYVRGGPRGAPTVILLPGWPQTWYAFRRIMPELAQTYDVIAIDPPGLGASDFAPEGYDTESIAAVIRDGARAIGVADGYTLIGHDVGAWISYAWVRRFEPEVGRLVLLDAAIPGVPSAQSFGLDRASNYFQFYFNAVPDLPEALTEGREDVILRWLFDNKTAVRSGIVEADLQEYLRSYRQPGRMSAGFNYYRAVPASMAQNLNTPRPLNLPILALGASKGTGDGLRSALSDIGSPDVRGGILGDCGHYVAEECPAALLAELTPFLSGDPVTR